MRATLLFVALTSCAATISFDEYRIEPPPASPTPPSEVPLYAIRGTVEGLDLGERIYVSEVRGTGMSIGNGPFASKRFLGDGVTWSLRITSATPGERGFTCAATPDHGVVMGADVTVAVRCELVPVLGCDTYEDRTAPDADRSIQGPTKERRLPYQPSCMRVRAGQTVTWTGDFAAFPIAIAQDRPTASGERVTYTFSAPGKFGFVTSQFMGAIHVVP